MRNRKFNNKRGGFKCGRNSETAKNLSLTDHIGPNMPHHGVGTESPFLVMSGSNCKLDMAGRYIRLPHHGTEGHKTIGNWYTTLLNAHGNPIEHYGDLDQTMSRLKLDQTGAIKQFMG